MDLRRRRMIRVELLHRGLQDFRFGSRTRLAALASRLPLRAPLLAPRTSLLATHQLNALDHLAAADLEHLVHRAGGADLQPERVAVDQAGARHLLLAMLQRPDRSQRVA